MGKGRKKMPGEQRELMGDPSNGRASIIKTEHLNAEFSETPPIFLTDPLALEVWADNLPIFKDLGFLSGGDRVTAAWYCIFLADLWLINDLLHQRLLDEEGNKIKETRENNRFTYESNSNHGKLLRKEPLLEQRTNVFKQMLACQKDLSLTTLDRQNMYMKITEYGGVGESRGVSAPNSSPKKPNEAAETGVLPGLGLQSPLGYGKTTKH